MHRRLDPHILVLCYCITHLRNPLFWMSHSASHPPSNETPSSYVTPSACARPCLYKPTSRPRAPPPSSAPLFEVPWSVCTAQSLSAPFPSAASVGPTASFNSICGCWHRRVRASHRSARTPTPDFALVCIIWTCPLPTCSRCPHTPAHSFFHHPLSRIPLTYRLEYIPISSCASRALVNSFGYHYI